jgi:hypothetical protein
VSRHSKLEALDSVASVKDQLFSTEYARIVARIMELCTVVPEEGG